jgi:2-aminomuconate deaminase
MLNADVHMAGNRLVCIRRAESLRSDSQMADSIHSSRAPEPVGPYPHARRIGNLLFLSGVGPRTKGSREVQGVELDNNGNIRSYDIEKQCHAMFNNVKMILEDAGSSWGRIIDVTVFLTNMKNDFEAFNRIYAEYFRENQPTRTTIEVGALPTSIAVEMKVIAEI